MSFAHLNVHSHYSLLQSSCTISGLMNKCLEQDMKSLALTDYGNMFGCLEFYFAALEHNIKPIIGCEMYYVDNCFEKSKSDPIHFRNPMKSFKTIVLIAKNLKGYRNLCHMNTVAYQDGFYFVPRIDFSILDKYKEGLIVLTGGQRGRLPHLYHQKGKDQALKEITQLKQIFGENLYLTFLPKGLKKGQEYNSFLAEAALSEKISLVAGNDVHYINKKDSIVQDALFCIGTNRTLSDRDRSKLGPSEFYFKDSHKMRNMYADSKFSKEYKEACDNTLKISDECSVHFKIKDKEGNPIYHLPKLKKSDLGMSLKELAAKGLENRFKEADSRGEPILEERKEEYQSRLKYELKIIENMGFTGYFQIVQDFIHWSKKQDIPVGPGRGSGASSLVSYSLGITDLDPMPLNLIFERFLNPERISMPDFDIDFCQYNRPKVIQYISEKYGADCTSHVITYGRLNVRGAIRDAGRVLGLSYMEVDNVAKLIPDILGINLKEALQKEPRLKALKEESPQMEELLKLAEMLEGLIRHVSIHAAGIIIADTPIVDYAPLYRGPDGENVIQYDLKHAEKIGLVKFDFLGLKTLTHIKETIQLIEDTKNTRINLAEISLKDKGIYQIMSQGDTAGVFQFEGYGITDLLIKAQPTCFEDIVA
ncbi:MAG: DNA polymerase III subunit alpha, partial [Bdellovibrionales bacterium]